MLEGIFFLFWQVYALGGKVRLMDEDWTRAQRKRCFVEWIIKGRCIIEERYGCGVKSFKI